MAKKVSKLSGAGKSPAKPASFEDMIGGHSSEIQATANRLRALVREVLPEADENIYGGAKTGIALYSIGGPNKVICGIQPSDGACLLYIHNITELTHPDLKLEGKGGNNRHVKFNSAGEIKLEPVKWLLGEGKRLCKP
ncbi:MAG: DUF1801 domain-containing protein [Blastocatellales bacterium]